MSSRERTLRSCRQGRAGESAGRAVATRGFSLLEVLVVVAIIGIVAMIAVWNVMQMANANRLKTAADSVRSLVQRGQNEMKMRGHAMFVELSQATAAPPTWRVRLWEDTNDNLVLDAEPDDTIVGTYLPGNSVAFSTTDTSQMATVNWSVNTATSDSRYLICDFLGRTFVPGPPRVQNTAAATLDITDVNMVPATSPVRGPASKYEIRISPVWSAYSQRYLWNTSTSSWTKS